MKKIIVAMLAIAMLLTAVSAVAEGRGGPMNGRMPSQGQQQQAPRQGGPMNGQAPNGGQRQAPNGRQAPNDRQAPNGRQDGQGQLPGDDSQGQQPPVDGGDQRHVKGQRPERPDRQGATEDNQAENSQNDDAQADDGQAGDAPVDGATSPTPKPAEGEKPADLPEQPAEGEKPADLPEQPAEGEKPADLPEQPAEGGTPNGAPEMNGPKRVDFDEMVRNGTISQETCDNIKAYMEAHRPEGEAPAQGQAPENGAAPEAPAGGEQPDLLGELLNAGVITQEEYDAMK